VLPLFSTVAVAESYTAGMERAVAMDTGGDSVLPFQLIWDMEEVETEADDTTPATATRGYNTSVVALSLAPTASSTSGGQVYVTMRYPKELTHNFGASKAARMPATLLLQNNTYATASGTVTLTDPQVAGGRNRFVWVGRTKITVFEIAPGGVAEVAMTGLATSPGVYDLAKFSIQLQGDGKELLVGTVPSALTALSAE
jgi:hypothetical protein